MSITLLKICGIWRWSKQALEISESDEPWQKMY